MDKKEIKNQDDEMFDPQHMKKQPAPEEKPGKKTIEDSPKPGDEQAP